LLVPSTSAINGFTRLAQLGGPLVDVRGEFLMLWGLTLFYSGIVSIAADQTAETREGI
jgi:ABC-2 type transport system permease protein